MIYNVNGILTNVEPTFAVIECSGVGLKCFISVNTLRRLTPIGSQVNLFTYMNVREDAMDLYGFFDTDELELFKLLIGVNGIGPKAAIAILNVLDSNMLSNAIIKGDTKLIQTAQGIGKKTAERVVLELKDKVLGFVTNDVSELKENICEISHGENVKAAIEVLVALGYRQGEATKVVNSLDKTLDEDALVRESLKYLSATL